MRPNKSPAWPPQIPVSDQQKNASEHCFLWAGPVSSANLRGAHLPIPHRLVTVNHGPGGGIGSSSFSGLGKEVGSARELLARHSVDLDACASLTIAGFSAAHGLIEILMRDQETRDRTRALVAADAYYTGGSGAIKPGYSAFCELAARGEKLAVFSSSPIAGPIYPSCTDSLAPMMGQFPLEPVRVTLTPAPAQSFRARGLWWLQYAEGPPKGHVMHATEVAPAVLSAFVAPLLAPAGADTFREALAAVAAVVLMASA